MSNDKIFRSSITAIYSDGTTGRFADLSDELIVRFGMKLVDVDPRDGKKAISLYVFRKEVGSRFHDILNIDLAPHDSRITKRSSWLYNGCNSGAAFNSVSAHYLRKRLSPDSWVGKEENK
jgi:hypothetical protein